MNFDELEFNNNPSNRVETAPMNNAKLEEIMLKNIWEIENNPIFSSNASIDNQRIVNDKI